MRRSQVQCAQPFDGSWAASSFNSSRSPLGCQAPRASGSAWRHLAFQEVSYTPFLALSARLPLWSAVASIVHETIRRCGADTEIGLALHQVFQQAGFTTQRCAWKSCSAVIGIHGWIYDLLCSLRPQIHEHGACLEP